MSYMFYFAALVAYTFIIFKWSKVFEALVHTDKFFEKFAGQEIQQISILVGIPFLIAVSVFIVFGIGNTILAVLAALYPAGILLNYAIYQSSVE